MTLAILTTFLIAFAPAAFADCKSRAGSTVVFNHGLRPGKFSGGIRVHLADQRDRHRARLATAGRIGAAWTQSAAGSNPSAAEIPLRSSMRAQFGNFPAPGAAACLIMEPCQAGECGLGSR